MESSVSINIIAAAVSENVMGHHRGSCTIFHSTAPKNKSSSFEIFDLNSPQMA